MCTRSDSVVFAGNEVVKNLLQKSQPVLFTKTGSNIQGGAADSIW